MTWRRRSLALPHKKDLLKSSCVQSGATREVEDAGTHPLREAEDVAVPESGDRILAVGLGELPLLSQLPVHEPGRPGRSKQVVQLDEKMRQAVQRCEVVEPLWG